MYGVYYLGVKVGVFNMEENVQSYVPIKEGIQEVEKKGVKLMNIFKTSCVSKNIEFFSSIVRNCSRFEDEKKLGYHTNKFYLIKE